MRIFDDSFDLSRDYGYDKYAIHGDDPTGLYGELRQMLSWHFVIQNSGTHRAGAAHKASRPKQDGVMDGEREGRAKTILCTAKHTRIRVGDKPDLK